MVRMIHLTKRLDHASAAVTTPFSLLRNHPRTTAPRPCKPPRTPRTNGTGWMPQRQWETMSSPKKPSSLHTPKPNDTTDRRSNISSWPGPNLNRAQSNGSSYVTVSSPPMQYYILNRSTPNPTTKPTSPPLIFHGYMTSLSRSTMHSQHSIPLTDTSTTTYQHSTMLRMTVASTPSNNITLQPARCG